MVALQDSEEVSHFTMGKILFFLLQSELTWLPEAGSFHQSRSLQEGLLIMEAQATKASLTIKTSPEMPSFQKNPWLTLPNPYPLGNQASLTLPQLSTTTT